MNSFKLLVDEMLLGNIAVPLAAVTAITVIVIIFTVYFSSKQIAGGKRNDKRPAADNGSMSRGNDSD